MQNKNMAASILFLFVGFVSMAQGGAPAPPPPTPPPPGLPIDGGLLVLFLFALGFGIYKTHLISRKSA